MSTVPNTAAVTSTAPAAATTTPPAPSPAPSPVPAIAAATATSGDAGSAAVTVTAPAVTTPTVTETVVTAPVVTAPVVTAPVVTAPVVTAPVVTTEPEAAAVSEITALGKVRSAKRTLTSRVAGEKAAFAALSGANAASAKRLADFQDSERNASAKQHAAHAAALAARKQAEQDLTSAQASLDALTN